MQEVGTYTTTVGWRFRSALLIKHGLWAFDIRPRKDGGWPLQYAIPYPRCGSAALRVSAVLGGTEPTDRPGLGGSVWDWQQISSLQPNNQYILSTWGGRLRYDPGHMHPDRSSFWSRKMRKGSMRQESKRGTGKLTLLALKS